VLIWDAPVRVFHWLMVLCFAGAWLSAESERWQLVHVTLGYTLAGLVAWRIVWGFIGTRHARFSDFLRGPGAVRRYLASLLRGHPEPHAGHNPAGALAIAALLGLGLAVSATGIAIDGGQAPHWLEELHEGIAGTMLGVVVVHVLGVVTGSWLHRENLVASMIRGTKHAPPAEAIAVAWRGLAVAMALAVLGFWLWQWRAVG
jgi:cytochrome b